MDDPRIFSRLSYRAWHRGTREADFMIGGFFDRYHKDWSTDDIVWFENLLTMEDVDIMAWAMQRETPPEPFTGPMMEKMQRLDYIEIP